MPRKPTPPTPKQEDWLARLRESSHDVFLAGLASLARTRGSGAAEAKPARTDFEALVAEGRKLEPDLRETVQKTWDDLRSRSTIGVLPLRTDGRLQGVFQERVEAAVRSLGLPTRAELNELNAKLDRLLQAQSAAAPARRAAAAAKKTAAGKATRGKAPPAKAAPRKAAGRKPAAR